MKTVLDMNSILNAVTDPAVLIDLNYKIIATNAAYEQHYQVDGTESRGRHCYEISHRYSRPCDQAGETCPLQKSLASGQPQRVLHLHYTPRGEEHVDVVTYPVRDVDGKIVYLLETMHSSDLASSQADGEGLVGRSKPFLKMLEMIHRVAPRKSAVLLQGESGTGKEVVAKAIHQASACSNGPFVPVECSGLTESLFESELFGHEKGAFTGAHNRKLGLVEAAKGGTLFLDEIGDVPLSLQVKLLRLLETASFRRVGSTDAIKAEFRLVCATHRNLKDMVAKGNFRQDLYFRISVFPIYLPPLRERGRDIELLSAYLLKRLDPERKVKLHSEVLECLRNYEFPGNVRELRNILERALILADGNEICMEHLPPECQQSGFSAASGFDFPDEVIPLHIMEERYLRWVTARFKGDNKLLASKLGLSERTFYRKLELLK